jgi:hypothetical protein
LLAGTIEKEIYRHCHNGIEISKIKKAVSLYPYPALFLPEVMMTKTGY